MHRVPKDLVRFAVIAANGNFYETTTRNAQLHVIPYLSAEAVLSRRRYTHQRAI